MDYEIEKPSLKLQSPVDRDCDSLIAEVKKIRGKKKPLSASALKALRDEYAHSIDPARRRRSWPSSGKPLRPAPPSEAAA